MVEQPGSVGVVETSTVRLFSDAEPLVLASGATLGPVDVAYETYGELNEARSNAVFICHALTGDAHAAGYHEGATRPGWWDNLIGPGKPLDTDRFFVVCANLIGGCQGSTGPSSTNPETGQPYGLDFPLLEVSDFVAVHRALFDGGEGVRAGEGVEVVHDAGEVEVAQRVEPLQERRPLVVEVALHREVDAEPPP